MPWTRLDPAGIVDALHIACVPGDAEDEAVAAQVLEHLCGQLLAGHFNAVQDHAGRVFIGTPDEGGRAHDAGVIKGDVTTRSPPSPRPAAWCTAGSAG